MVSLWGSVFCSERQRSWAARPPGESGCHWLLAWARLEGRGRAAGCGRSGVPQRAEGGPLVSLRALVCLEAECSLMSRSRWR